MTNVAPTWRELIAQIRTVADNLESATRQIKLTRERWIMATKISVDYETDSDAWWQAARQASDCPSELHGIVYGDEDDVTVSECRANEIADWCAALPGWRCGPIHSPAPLLFDDVDSDGDADPLSIERALEDGGPL